MTTPQSPFDPTELRVDFRNEDFWTLHTPRFLSYAASLIARRRWRGSYGEHPAGGQEPHDYVIRTVTSILEGHRHCPPDVDPVPFVFGVIRSLVAHDADNLENRHPHARVTTDDADEGGVIEEDQFVDGQSPSADDLLTAADLARDFIHALPEQYRAYVELLISGEYASATEYAERLGTTVAEIRLMDKALRRRRRLWKGTSRR